MVLARQCCAALEDYRAIFGVRFSDVVTVLCNEHYQSEANDLKFRSLREAFTELAKIMLRGSIFIPEALRFLNDLEDQLSLYLLIQPEFDYSTPLGKVIIEYKAKYGQETAASLASPADSFAEWTVEEAECSLYTSFEQWKLYAKRLLTLITLGGLGYMVQRDQQAATQMMVDEMQYPLPLEDQHRDQTVREVAGHKLFVPVWYSED